MIAAISSKRRALKLGTALATCIACVVTANAAMGQAITDLPTGGIVAFTDGIAASITYNTNNPTNATAVEVDANASSQVINWKTFSVADGNFANFVSKSGVDANGQPIFSTTPITVVNRVVGVPKGMGANFGSTFYPSTIAGGINSSNNGNNNISLWLVNPAGITFGPTGTFSGGSLVLSTLDFDAEPTGVIGDGTAVGFKLHVFPENPGKKDDELTLPDGVTAVELKLSAVGNSSALSPKSALLPLGQPSPNGSLLLIGSQIVSERNISADGTVAFVAANAVNFSGGVGSPITYAISAGTALSGIEIAKGSVSGQKIIAAAVSEQGAKNALLKVGTMASLTATIVNGTVMLTTFRSAASNATGNGDEIVSDGKLLSGNAPDNTPLAGINVTVASAGKAAVSGEVAASGNYTVSGSDVILGKTGAAAVTQSAGKAVAIAALGQTAPDANQNPVFTPGTITGHGNLTLKSNTAATQSANYTLLLDAGSGTIDFKSGSTLASGTGAGAAAIGLRFGAANNLSLGTVTAADKVANYNDAMISTDPFDSNGISKELVGDGNFTADAITTDQDFTAKFAKNIAVNSITVNNGKAIALTAGGNIGGRLAGTGIDLTSKPVDPMAMPLIKGDIALSAGKTLGGIITVGTADARNLSATAGDNAGDPVTGKGGEIGIGTATLTGDLNIGTYYAAPDANQPDGEIRLGKIDVGGTANVFTSRILNADPMVVASGDIVISGHLVAKGNIGLSTTRLGDLLVANYVAGLTPADNVGLVQSTAGNITATLYGSVLASADPAFATAVNGIAGYKATGSITVNTVYDFYANSLDAGTFIQLNVGGSLLGLEGGSVTVPGGRFVASGTAGYDVEITAGGGANKQAITASSIAATGTVKLTADKIAVGTVDVVTKPNLVTSSAALYVGVLSVQGNLNLPDPVVVTAITTDVTAIERFDAMGNRMSEYFGTANRNVDLTAGTYIKADVVYGADLGQVIAKGADPATMMVPTAITFTAGGLVADKITTTAGSIGITTNKNYGTLSLLDASSAKRLNLQTAQDPMIVPDPAQRDGADLRVVKATVTGTGATAADITADLTSITSTRIGDLTVTAGRAIIEGNGGDVTGLKVAGTGALGAGEILLGPITNTPDFTTSLGAAPFGKANITVSQDSSRVDVRADSGVVRLGTITQGNGALAATTDAGISASGLAVSANILVANSGSVTVFARNAANPAAIAGTVALGSVEARGTVDLSKIGAADVVGNNLRFGAVTAHGNMASGAELLAVNGLKTVAARIISATSVVGTGPLAGDVTTDIGAIRVNAPGLIQLDVVSAKGDVSIEAGSNGLMLPRSGQIVLATAASTDGAVRLTSVNDTTPLATGIRFSAITAKTDVELITAGDLGARIVGGSINETGGSSGHVYADSATAISLTTATAGTDIGLRAATDIGAGTLTAGGSIAGDAGGSISVGTSTANGGDIGYRATSTINLDNAIINLDDATARRSIYAKTTVGDIVVGTARANGGDLLLDAGRDVFLTDGQAAGDVRLIGGSVRVDKAKALGTVLPGGFGVPGFGLIAFSDPRGTGIVGRVPSFGFGAYGGLNGSIVITARNGDVTGLLTGVGTPALLARVTKTDKLSTANDAIDAFKASTLDARQDIVVTADLNPVNAASLVGGGIQLGTILAGNDISVTGDAATIANATATAGKLSVTARIGTLAVEKGTSGLTTKLDKLGGSRLTDGDDLRVGTLIAGNNVVAPKTLTDSTAQSVGKSVILTSSTSIRVDKITGMTGDVILAAAAGDVTGRRDRIAVPDPQSQPAAYLTLSRFTNDALLTPAFGKGDVTASVGSLTITAAQPDVMVRTGGLVQLNDVTAGTDLTVTANAISLHDATATTGLLTLTATDGTLVLRDALAKKKAKLVKQDKQDKQSDPLAKTGNEIRFNTVTGGSSGDDPVGAELTSSTHVRGIGATATAGDIAIKAGSDGLDPVRAGMVTDRTPTDGIRNFDLTANAGAIRVRSGGLTELGNVRSRDDIAVSAGTPLGSSFDTKMAGAIFVGRATSTIGSISLVNRNYSGGDTGVGFDTLSAGRDVEIVTRNADHGGGASGDRIGAGGHVWIDVGTIGINTIDAGFDISLRANGNISGRTFTSRNSSIFGDAMPVTGNAAGDVTVTSLVRAGGGDAAFRAAGAIKVGTIEAQDDVSLIGKTVTVDQATAGLGEEVQNPLFDGPFTSFEDKQDVTFFGSAIAQAMPPVVKDGGNLTLRATVGDVTVKTSATAKDDIIVDAKLAAYLGKLNPTRTPVIVSGKSLAIKAGTSVEGYEPDPGRRPVKAGVLTAGEDIGILAGTAIKLSDATAGDDLTARAFGDLAGDITADALKSTAVGGKDRSISFSSVSPTVAFVAERTELADSNVSLETTRGRIDVVTVDAQRLLAQAKTGFTATGAIATGFATPSGNALPADTTLTTAKIVVTNGDIRFTTITAANAGHDVALQASGAIRGGGISAGRSIGGTAGGAIDIASSVAGADIRYTAGSTANLGEATAGGNYSVNAVSDITLGRDVANAAPLTVHTAGGSVTIASTGGSIREGTMAGVKLTANNDGKDSEALTLDAKGNMATKGDIALANAILTAGNGTSTSDALLTATGAVTFDKLVADNNATVGAATGSTLPTSLTANAITASKGSISGTVGSPLATSGTIDVASSRARINIGYEATSSVSLGEATAETGNYTVKTAGAITLGRPAMTAEQPAKTVHQAGGAVSITSTGAGIAEGVDGLAITANSNGMDSETLSLDSAGNIGLANAALKAGTGASLSDALLTAKGAVTFKTLVAENNATIGAKLAATPAPTSLTAAGIAATKGSISGTAGTIDVATSVAGAAIGYTAGTTASLGEATAGGNYTVTAGGAITLGRTGRTVHQAGGAVTITSTGAGIAKGVDGLAITANSNGKDSEILSLDAAGDIALAKATLKAGTGASASDALLTAKGTVTFETLVAENNATIGAKASGTAPPTSLTAGSITATKGSISGTAGIIDVVSSNSGINIGYTAGTTASLGEATAGGNYTVTAGGAITLGRTGKTVHKAGGAVAITSTGAGIAKGIDGLAITANGDGVGSETLTMTAKTDIALENSALKGGIGKQSDILLKSFTGSVKIGLVTGKDISLTGKDALIGGDVMGDKISVFDLATDATNPLRLGVADTDTGAGFKLTAEEVSRLKADTLLTFDTNGGGNPGAMKQDVKIGAISLTTPATVNVFANDRRIDVTGKITVSDKTKTLALGGDGSVGLASVLYIAATPGGGGGQILASGVDVKLNAANIAAGLDKGFGDKLKVTGTGTGDVVEAKRLNDDGNSTLYFASNEASGASYDTGINLLTANTLTVTYTGFALFQNTGVPGLTTGVVLNQVPTMTALALKNATLAITPVFGLFGKINGREGIATALLGSPQLVVGYKDIGSSRINGCIIGGGNCLSVQTVTPSLSGMDSIRADIFFVNPNFELPFDPLIGTSNDSLIGDVGSFGLGDVPMAPIECSDPKGKCPAQKKDGN